MTPPINITGYPKLSPLTGLIGMGGGATSHRVYTASSSGDYQVGKSLRIDQGDQANLSWTPGVGSKTTFTISVWFKRTKPGDESNLLGNYNATSGNWEGFNFYVNTDDKLEIHNYDGSSYNLRKRTYREFRDPAAWYHVVCAIDTTNDVAADRVRLYINGERETLFAAETDPSQNLEVVMVPANQPFNIGYQYSYSDSLVAGIYFIDGLALSPAAFGSFDANTDEWNPKELALPSPNDGTSWSSGSTVTSQTGSFDTNNTPAGLFDGDISGGSTDCVDASSTGNWVKWTPTTAMTFSQGVRVYTGSGSTNDYDIKIVKTGTDDTDYNLILKNIRADNAAWTQLYYGSGKIEYIQNNPVGSTHNNWAAIEVDGVVLVDSKIDTSTRNNPNDNIVWSNFITAKSGSFHGSHPATYAFNGNLSNKAGEGSNGADNGLVFTPNNAFTNVTTLRFYGESVGANMRFRIHDGTSWESYHSDSDAIWNGSNTAWRDISEFIPSNKKVKQLEYESLSGGHAFIGAIEINGHILVDSIVDNSFHLKFEDSSSLGKDSLNSNNFTANNLAASDISVDAPSNYLPKEADGTDADETVGGVTRGNYATLNPISPGIDCTLTQGNLSFAYGTSASLSPTPATFGMAKGSGKWYWEVEVTEAGSWCHGIVNTCVNSSTSSSVGTGYYIGHNTTGWGVNSWGQGVTHNNSTSQANYLGSGDIQSSFTGVLGFAFDADNGYLWVRKDGTWGASATTTEVENGTTTNAASSTITVGDGIFWFPAVSDGSGTGSDTSGRVNFGQRAFSNAAPTGYKCLCALNLPDTFGDNSNADADKNIPGKYFDVRTYSGDDEDGKDIMVSPRFSPDLLWLKERNQDYSIGHRWYDRANGAGINKHIDSSSYLAEGGGNDETYGYVSAFTSTGFTASAGSSDIDYANKSGNSYVAYTWDAGTSANTSNLNDGTINISSGNQWVNEKTGFSITKYSGNNTNDATISHGLSAPPKVVIIKCLSVDSDGSAGSHWVMKHAGISMTNTSSSSHMYLNQKWEVKSNDHGTVITHGSDDTLLQFKNGSGSPALHHVNGNHYYTMYCWRDIPGFSSFGFYDGQGAGTGSTGNAGGFIYTGFQPRWLMVKSIDVDGEEWMMYDSIRDIAPSGWTNTGNPRRKYLHAQDGIAEYEYGTPPAARVVSLHSNGFHFSGDQGYAAPLDYGGYEYIWMAFADKPFKTARAR